VHDRLADLRGAEVRLLAVEAGQATTGRAEPSGGLTDGIDANVRVVRPPAAPVAPTDVNTSRPSTRAVTRTCDVRCPWATTSLSSSIRSPCAAPLANCTVHHTVSRAVACSIMAQARARPAPP